MAQWMGQFSGLTHETKVQDLENSLRVAINSCKATTEAPQRGQLGAIQHLSKRLLAARLKALRARISALTEPGGKRRNEEEVSRLRAREQELQSQGIDGILKEFGA